MTIAVRLPGRVGKTSILLRYIKGEYDERQVSTLQASYLDKRLLVDNAKVQLSLWDTAGQERFHALGPIYYRDADGALLVYDITSEESFQKVRMWVKELRRIVGDDIDICIAGNKVDLHRNRKVDEDEAQRYADSVGATHWNTSAKLNRGLEDVFVDLTKRMLARKASKKKKSTLIADDEPSSPPRSSTGRPAASSSASAAGRTSAGASASAAGRASAPGEPNARSRGGGRGQAIQIVDDDDSAPASSSSAAATRMSNGLRIRGASAQMDVGKAKSGCC